MITDLLAHWASKTPNKAFLITDDGSYTFEQIYAFSRRFASMLRSGGITSNDQVAILADNSASYVVAWFGINLAGAVAVTLNNQLVSDGLRYSVEQSDAKLILTDQTWIEEKSHHLSGQLSAIPTIEIGQDRAFFDALTKFQEASDEQKPTSATSAIIYTSGTTGLPKGVMNSHGAYEAVGRATADMVELTSEDVIMAVLPMFHANTQMFGVMPVLTVGATLALRKKFSASNFFEDAKRFGATGHPAVGTVISILLTRYPEAQTDHSMRFVIGGGISGTSQAATARIMTDYKERFGITIYEAFGSTETGGWCTGNTARNYRIGSNGRPRPDMEVAIFNELDEEVPTGMEGEIVVRSRAPNVMLTGYWKKPEETLKSCRNLWFHTGDRGRFDDDGYLYFTGRYKELIRKKGEMISPVEIENALRTMTGVDDCAAVGIPDDIVGEEIKVCVVANARLEPADVRNHLSEHLPAYMLPRYVQFVAEIPKTETQKVHRASIAALGESVIDLGA